MPFITDLNIHSPYAWALSKQMTPEKLSAYINKLWVFAHVFQFHVAVA